MVTLAGTALPGTARANGPSVCSGNTNTCAHPLAQVTITCGLVDPLTAYCQGTATVGASATNNDGKPGMLDWRAIASCSLDCQAPSQTADDSLTWDGINAKNASSQQTLVFPQVTKPITKGCVQYQLTASTQLVVTIGANGQDDRLETSTEKTAIHICMVPIPASTPTLAPPPVIPTLDPLP